MSQQGLGFARRRLLQKIIEENWEIKDPNKKIYKYNELLFILQEMLNEEGKAYLSQTTVNRGFAVFRHFVKHLLYRNLANYDSMLLITSEKGCLTDDTLIEMPRDKQKYPKGIPIKKLIGKGSIYVYSFNVESKKIELKLSDGVEFVKKDDVWEVELTNGQMIKATKDHPFLLMDGKYKQLKDLVWLNKIKNISTYADINRYRKKGKSGWYYTDRLRVFFRPDKLETELLKIDYNKIDRKKVKGITQCVIEHRFICEQLYGNIDNKIIHHIDGNHYNNDIKNLSIEEHSSHHKIHGFDNFRFKKGNNFGSLKKGITFKKGILKIKKGTEEYVQLCRRNKIAFFKNPENKDRVKKFCEKRKIINRVRSMCQTGGVIKSIKYIGKQNVYDVVNVQDNKNFIANGFVVSNTGKSSAAIMLAREHCKLLGIKFNPARHIAYSNAEMMTKIDNLKPFEPLIADEAIRFASAADWAKKENKALKMKLAQVRTKHLLFILCFPLKVYKLEKTYLESYVNYWCFSRDTKITIKNKKGQILNKQIYKLCYEKDYEVMTYNIKKDKFEFKKPEKTIKTKSNAEVYEVKLVNGMKVKATTDHLFLTKNGYKKLIDLTEDDSIKTIALPYKIKKIRKLKEKVDVYDIIGVPDNHNFIANNMVAHNCDLFGRGKGAIYVKDKNPIMDSWRMKEFAKIGSYTEFTNISQVNEKLKKHPNYWCLIKFPKPPSWLYSRYLNVREKNVYDDENVMANVSKEDIHRAALLLTLRDIMLNDQTLTMNRVAIHIKNNYDMSLTKGMINSVVSDSELLINKIREQQLIE